MHGASCLGMRCECERVHEDAAGGQEPDGRGGVEGGVPVSWGPVQRVRTGGVACVCGRICGCRCEVWPVIWRGKGTSRRLLERGNDNGGCSQDGGMAVSQAVPAPSLGGAL